MSSTRLRSAIPAVFAIAVAILALAALAAAWLPARAATHVDPDEVLSNP